jgi:hypothetical protein
MLWLDGDRPRRSAEGVPWNPLGAVTYLKSAGHTLRDENGGSRLVVGGLGTCSEVFSGHLRFSQFCKMLSE